MSTDLQTIRESLETFVAIPLDEPRTPDNFLYYSPEVFELELEHIWKKEWIAVGHTAWLKEPGDYFAWEILNEPIVVAKGLDGEIRAMSSICRHRAVPLTEDGERGNLKSFQCPYHLWSFGLDGKCVGAPYMEDNKAFDKSKIALPQYRVEVWMGVVFVNFDDDAEPLAPRLEEFAPTLEYCDREDLVNHNVFIDVWNTNWKQAMENGDVYHGNGVHPEAMAIYDKLDMTQPTVQGDHWAKQVLTMDLEYHKKKVGFEPYKDEIGMVGRDLPAFDMCITPPANFLMVEAARLGIQLIWPISIDKTRVVMFSVARPEHAGKKHTPEELADPRGPNMVNFQDSRVFDRGISRAVRSSRSEPGLMSPTQEGPAIAMHKWWARKLLDGIDETTNQRPLAAVGGG